MTAPATNLFARLVEFRKVRPKTKLVRLARNFGAVAAGKAGMKFVTGDCFMSFPADLQDPLDDVVRMVEQWIAGHKLVLAVRRSRADPLMTRAFAAIFRTIVRFTVKHDYPSGGVGMMLMDKVMLAPMQNSAKNINPNVYAFWLGFDPVIIEYDRLERKHGRSRWTFAKKSQYLIDTITGFSVVPVRIVTCIGLITAMISFPLRFLYRDCDDLRTDRRQRFCHHRHRDLVPGRLHPVHARRDRRISVADLRSGQRTA